jgi:hypothetical protein
MARRRNGQHTAMNDMLSNIALGFIMLFIIALIMMNPITKKHDIPTKNEFMIVLEWQDNFSDDVDLWVQFENERPVGFRNRINAHVGLDRDDLGYANDYVVVDGQRQLIKVNREVINIRGVVPGNYYVAAHVYSKSQSLEDGPIKIKITVLDVNPYKEAYDITLEATRRGDVVRFPAFTINEDGDIVDVFKHNRVLTTARAVPARPDLQ